MELEDVALYVPIGKEKRKISYVPSKREGEVLETEAVAQRIYVPTWRNRKKRKEKDRI